MDGDFIRESIELKERFNIKAGAGSAFRSLYTSVTLVQKPVIILPAAIYLLIQLGAMYLYLGSHTTPWTQFWAFFSGSAEPEQLGHFPEHLIFLQPILGRATIILDAFLNIVFQGATVFLVSKVYRDKKASLQEGFSVSLSRYFQMVMVSIASGASIYAAINIPRLLSGDLPGLVSLGLSGTGVVLALLVQVLFLYAIPIIILQRPKTSEVFPATFRMAWRFAAPSLFIVFLPFILTTPTTFLNIKAELIAMQLSPDFMIHSHIASLVMETIAAFLITAGATIFIIRKTSERK